MKREADSDVKLVKKVKSSSPVVKKYSKPDKSSKANNKIKAGSKDNKKPSKDYSKKTNKFNKPTNNLKDSKPEDWNEFKKKKKELKLKRKQERAGNSFDVIAKAKKIGEKLRCKLLKGGEVERNKLINELHTLLRGKSHYEKFVLAHDTARIVQWLLKYSSKIVVEQISKEIIPVSVEMMQSKYGIHCVKRLLKYGTAATRQEILSKFEGHAVKLASNALSSPVFEYAYSNFASQTQKYRLMQEFYGDLYKNSKDNIKHLKEVYKDDETLKAATLSAVKANLGRILNKNLLDSALVQSICYQFLSECSDSDRSELISQLASHVVVISNSKDGARTAMICIWQGTNKDRKTIMKSLNKHLIELCKHEHGHCTVIALLDSIDDTVLLQKTTIQPILAAAKDLALNDWGRKVLLWLISPGNSTIFHPHFINELKEGRERSTCKKSSDIRQKEILNYSIKTLIDVVVEEPEFWLKNASVAVELVAILKSATKSVKEELETAFNAVADIILKPDWKIEDGNGIEHAGIHMALKKLALNDKSYAEEDLPTFGQVLTEKLEKDTIEKWLKLNRGCFLLVAIYENGTENTQSLLRNKLNIFKKLLKSEKSQGSKILLKKINS